MIKYIGKGSFVQGIPARDLTKDEWDAFSKERQKSLVNAGLYKVPKRKVEDRVIPLKTKETED